jgi:hypothetical protein
MPARITSVRTESLSRSVARPTSTPSTSVIVFSGPA